MKTKFFLFGFFTSIVIVGFSIFGVFNYFQNKQNKNLQKEMENETELLNINITNFNNRGNITFNSLDLKNTFSINESSKNLVFINFWATWCAPCIAEMPSFEALILDDKIKNNIDFLFVSKEKKELIKKSITEKKFKLPFYYYTKNNVNDSVFIHKSIPTSYIIDKKRSLLYTITGSYNWNSQLLKDYLNSLIIK